MDNKLAEKIIKQMKDNGIEPITRWTPPPVISTGIPILDELLGGGGKKGGIISVVGDPNTGKTTQALLWAAYITTHPEEFANGGKVLMIDAEMAFMPSYAKKLGVYTPNLDVYHIPRGEDILNLVQAQIILNAYDLIIIDSVPKVGFEQSQNGLADDKAPAVAARIWSPWFNRIQYPLLMSDTLLYLVNQETTNFDKYAFQHLYGGRRQFHDSYCIIRMLSAKKPEDNGGKLMLRPKIVRNKLTGRKDQCEYDIRLDVPIPFVDVIPQFTSLGKKYGVFTNADGGAIKGAPYWYFEGEQIADATGEKPVMEALRANKDLRRQVQVRINEIVMSLNEPEEEPDRPKVDPHTGEVLK